MEWKEKLAQLLRLKYFLPVSLGAVSAAVLVRILQLNVAVDFSTGFFSRDTFLVPLLTVLLSVYLVYAAAVLLLHPASLKQPYRLKNTLPAAILMASAGIVLVPEGIASFFQQQNASAGILERTAALLEAASGGVLLYQAFLIWKKEEKRLKNHVLFLLPAVWSLLDLIQIFVHHTTVASISEYVFEILFSAALVVFLVYYSRFTAGLLQRRQKRQLLISGAVTAVLGAVVSVPPFFCRLFEFEGIGQYVSLPSLSSLAFTLVSALLMVLFVRETLSASKRGRTGSASDCEYGCETVGVEGLLPNRLHRMFRQLIRGCGRAG